MHKKHQTLVIAEYRPFNHQAHIFSMILHPSSVSNILLPTQLFSPPTHKGGRMEDYLYGKYGRSGWNGTLLSPLDKVQTFFPDYWSVKNICVVYCRGSCMWALEVKWSNWMWKTVPIMETDVRSVSYPEILTVAGMAPTAPLRDSKTTPPPWCALYICLH